MAGVSAIPGKSIMAKHRSAVALNLAIFFFMFGVGMIVPLLPRKIIALNGSLQSVGYLASAFAVSFVLLQFPMGRLADRFGFKKFIMAGYLTCAASGLFYCFSDTPKMIFLGRMLQGIGEAPMWALAPALLSILYPVSKGKVIGFYNASIHLGLTGGSAAAIFVSALWLNNESFLLFSLTGVLGFFFILVGVREPDRKAASEGQGSLDREALLALFKDPLTLVVFGGIILYGAGYGIFITVLPGFLIQDAGFSPTQIGWFFMLFYVAISLSQAITGPISDRHGSWKTMVSGLMAVALGVAMFSGRQQTWALYAWLFAASFGLGVFCVSALAWLNGRVGDSLKGTVSGTFYLLWGIGYFLAPPFLGSAGRVLKTSTGFYLMALCYFVLAFFLGLVHYRRKSGSGKT